MICDPDAASIGIWYRKIGPATKCRNVKVYFFPFMIQDVGRLRTSLGNLLRSEVGRPEVELVEHDHSVRGGRLAVVDCAQHELCALVAQKVKVTGSSAAEG